MFRDHDTLRRVDDFLIDDVCQRIVDVFGFFGGGCTSLCALVMVIGLFDASLDNLEKPIFEQALSITVSFVIYCLYFFPLSRKRVSLSGKEHRNSLRLLPIVQAVKFIVSVALVVFGVMSIVLQHVFWDHLYIVPLIVIYILCCDDYNGTTLRDEIRKRQWSRSSAAGRV